MFTTIKRGFKDTLSWINTTDTITVNFVMKKFVVILTDLFIILAPIFFVVMLIPVITVFAQTRGFVGFKHVKFSFSKLNPIQGFKRLFSLSSLFNIVKSIAELAVILTVLYFRLRDKLGELVRLIDMDILTGLVYMSHVIFDVAITIGVIFTFVSAVDYLYQYWNYEKNLRMSKQDLKEEHKQQEGDPIIKSKIKQKQREISQRRMKDQVAASDVVVRNPEHIAVAMKYDPDLVAAPFITVIETDKRAMRVIQYAMEAGIPVVTDRAVARQIYNEKLKPGSFVPTDLFGVIAEIFAHHVLKTDEDLKRTKLL